MVKAKKQSEAWRDRVVGFERRPAKDFLANSLNFRRHPNAQREAFRGIAAEVGFVGAVLENRTTGNLIDGHLRIEEALSKDENQLIPCIQVELSEDEERLILATYDPISQMATADKETLDMLLHEVSTGDAAVQEMLANLAEENGIIPSDEWAGALGALPSGEKAPIEQMTFTLATEQAALVRTAIDRAKSEGGFDGTGNENSNGNALARICEAYCG